jgi:glycosyltransferase involved in cell wall biosynthesis
MVVDAGVVEGRLASLEGRVLRLVYCGRLVPRKGVAESVELVRRARARGAELALDIIGNGPRRRRCGRNRRRRLGPRCGCSARAVRARPAA